MHGCKWRNNCLNKTEQLSNGVTIQVPWTLNQTQVCYHLNICANNGNFMKIPYLSTHYPGCFMQISFPPTTCSSVDLVDTMVSSSMWCGFALWCFLVLFVFRAGGYFVLHSLVLKAPNNDASGNQVWSKRLLNRYSVCWVMMSEMEVVWQCLSTKLESKLALLIPVACGLRLVQQREVRGGFDGVVFCSITHKVIWLWLRTFTGNWSEKWAKIQHCGSWQWFFYIAFDTAWLACRRV